MDAAHKGFLFNHNDDLYYATLDGTTAVRLTDHPGAEQYPQFSPDGRSVAFIRDHDLHVVDIAAPHERSTDYRRHRDSAARHGRLGVFRGDLQSPLAGFLVESRLEANRAHGIR